MRRVLGKGLSQLLGEQEEGSHVREAKVAALVPNPRQPRKHFDEGQLQELADSIAKVGVVQPIVVRPLDAERFEIIAGERRWRAAQMAGLLEVPIVVRSADNAETLQLALIENIQREDIAPLECAEAYQLLIDNHALTQEDLSKRVGKSRSAIANTLRLLKLPVEVRKSLAVGEISEGHARALLQFDTEAEQTLVHRRILEKGLSVREVERLAKGKSAAAKAQKEQTSPPAASRLDSALSEFFGSPARISRTNRGGKIEVEFFSEDDLSRILEKLDISI